MGVPAFFRWLSKKYPSIIVHCVEEKVCNQGRKKSKLGPGHTAAAHTTLIKVDLQLYYKSFKVSRPNSHFFQLSSNIH